jgi:hypothetical protein
VYIPNSAAATRSSAAKISFGKSVIILGTHKIKTSQPKWFPTIEKVFLLVVTCIYSYKGVDKSLARPTSRYISFNGENISFDASLVIYIYK